MAALEGRGRAGQRAPAELRVPGGESRLSSPESGASDRNGLSTDEPISGRSPLFPDLRIKDKPLFGNIGWVGSVVEVSNLRNE